MLKKLWTFAVVTLGTIACFVAFSSYAKDQDDFFKKHRQDILERDKEDALSVKARRAEAIVK